MNNKGRLIVVSNRLPITVELECDTLKPQPSCGGLVSALAPIMRESGGCWVGWTGTAYDAALAESVKGWCVAQSPFLEPVFLTTAEIACYYRGFANEIIWPLFHGLPSRCQFGSNYWNAYCQVNEKFARAVDRVSRDGDLVWVQDYHLMMLADALRTSGFLHRLAYFHHIPFPPVDVFETLPWRVEVLRALMRFNVIGFQTERDRKNFVASLRYCFSGVRVVQIGKQLMVRVAGACATIGTYPISVDYQELAREASEHTVECAATAIRSELAGVRIILGVDRLDYTKGIPERLTAFETFLKANRDMHGKLSMIQIVVPSREDIPEYTQLKLRIEVLVSRINGEYGRPGWVPIHYFYRSIRRSELLAFYRAADIAMVTPLKDGMNLIAKEFCASRIDNRGVLVLSEFAGAADELRQGAILVNPHDTDKVASVLGSALRMEQGEQRRRMEIMRSHIQEHDVFHWSRAFTSQTEPPNFNIAPSPIPWHTDQLPAVIGLAFRGLGR